VPEPDDSDELVVLEEPEEAEVFEALGDAEEPEALEPESLVAADD
jgi:hypothetical protein